MTTEPTKTKAYIAGPMRSVGPPDYNYAAFKAAQLVLEELGYSVFNPHECDANKNRKPDDIRAALADDLWWICTEADIVVVLPFWESSMGTQAEMATARAIGIPVRMYEEVTEALYVAG